MRFALARATLATLATLAILARSARGHVPRFADRLECVDSLIVEPEVSQVIYFPPAGAGEVFGVALDARAHTDVGRQLRSAAGLLVSMGTAGGEPVDAFVGCAAPARAARLCNSSAPWRAPLGGLALRHRGEAALEPFTQTAYHAIEFASGGERLRWGEGEGGCGGPNVTLVAAMRGRLPGVAVRGSVVVGKAERFTVEQLFLFPVFVARLHGSYGNANYVFGIVLASTLAVALVAAGGALAAAAPGAAARARRGAGGLRGVGAGSALLAVLLYAAVSIDLLLHVRGTLQRVRWDREPAPVALFVAGVLVSANLLPALVAAYLARLHAGAPAGSAPSAPRTAAAAVGLLLAAYSAALALLGEAPQVPAVVGSVVGAAFAAALALSLRGGGGEAALVALSAGLCAVLLLYLGSGYWVAPLSLAVSVTALAARLARHPPGRA